ncbi:MAG TPA: hypothetical protein VKU60_18830, partial [Chloroflexota bacterium]|nr:hypothetical protein [Chloroflexota bacterium]
MRLKSHHGRAWGGRMDFRETYEQALKEYEPRTYYRLMAEGKLGEHLRAKTAEAHELLALILAGDPNGADRVAVMMAEEEVFAELLPQPPDEVQGEDEEDRWEQEPHLADRADSEGSDEGPAWVGSRQTGEGPNGERSRTVDHARSAPRIWLRKTALVTVGTTGGAGFLALSWFLWRRFPNDEWFSLLGMVVWCLCWLAVYRSIERRGQSLGPGARLAHLLPTLEDAAAYLETVSLCKQAMRAVEVEAAIRIV